MVVIHLFLILVSGGVKYLSIILYSSIILMSLYYTQAVLKLNT